MGQLRPTARAILLLRAAFGDIEVTETRRYKGKPSTRTGRRLKRRQQIPGQIPLDILREERPSE